MISIHAPRTGSDGLVSFQHSADGVFQSTLPARGATFAAKVKAVHAGTFQSTLPARGATPVDRVKPYARNAFQSTLPARGATAWTTPSASGARNFNPRSPHGERRCRLTWKTSPLIFQSTLPARGATFWIPSYTLFITISIHAPRTGSDMSIILHTGAHGRFQSTLPARGATRMSCFK